MTSWISIAYTIAALIVVGLLMYIMQKVEDDRWSKTDPLWLQWLRRAAFVGTSLTLLYSIHSIEWQLTCFVLVSASGVILGINAVALHLRAPPRSGRRAQHQVTTFSYLASIVAHYFSAHR